MVDKHPVEIEKLLQWAFREELPKRQTSSAEGIWSRIERIGHGGLDHGHGAAQRYPHFGLPHEDAYAIEGAVAALEDATIDWEQDADAILGDLVALVEPRKSLPEGPHVGWYYADRKPVSVEFDQPRSVIMVRSLRTNALVVMNAKMGTRPDWRERTPVPSYVQAERSATGTPKLVGECRGKDSYSTGTYCPLRWSPSPIIVAEARVDYLAWWRGLAHLAATLDLVDHQALPPSVPEMPWRDPEELATMRPELWPAKMTALPLRPARKLAGAPEPRRRASAVRSVGH